MTAPVNTSRLTVYPREETPERPLISIIAPCYNESETVDLFVKTISGVLASGKFDYELVFVDDGSADDTRQRLEALAASHENVYIIALSRNFGKEAALTAGLDYARGDAVVVIDVDLQDPPELILDFVSKWREGYDVVYAIREDRQSDTAAKRVTAGGFYQLFNKISATRIPENAGDYRLMDRRVVETIKSLPERSRFMKGLFAWVGYKAIGVPYVRPERSAGETKFNFWRLWNFALDGITSFSTAPLRVWTYFGGVVAVLSLVYALAIVLRTLIFGIDVPGYASLLVFVLFFGSIQMISVGVLGEYIARLFVEVKRRPVYVIDDVIGDNRNTIESKSEKSARA
ncbi:MAG: glycosyltransferase family 2 protein [Pseudomonadota bacterium]